jgi:hypothetical protein
MTMEDERLAEADDGERGAEADRQLAEHLRARDVGDAGRRLTQEVVLAWCYRRFHERQRDQRRGRTDEGCSVDHRDDVAAEGGEEPGSGYRRDDPQPFAQRLQDAVRLAELLVRQHRLQHRRA